MKRFFCMLLVCLLIVSAATGCRGSVSDDTAAQTQSKTEKKPDLELVNMTNMEINNITISVSAMDSWSNNLLKGGVFYRGEKAEITYADLSDAEMYDIKCEDKDGNSVIFSELPLFYIKSIMLTVDENGLPVTAVTEKDGVTVPEEFTEESTEEETSGEGI